MEQRQPQGPTLPWVLGGGVDDHANMFLEREDEAREEWQARPVLESKWASVRTTWVLDRVEAVSEHTPDPWIPEDILTRSLPQSHVHVNDTVQMRNGDREGKLLAWWRSQSGPIELASGPASAESVGHFGLQSLPSPCLPSQGVDRWLNQSLTPLPLYSPAWRGQSELRGHPRRAPPPAWPASCPFPGSTGQRIPGKTTTWVCIWGCPPQEPEGLKPARREAVVRARKDSEEQGWSKTKRGRG